MVKNVSDNLSKIISKADNIRNNNIIEVFGTRDGIINAVTLIEYKKTKTFNIFIKIYES